jgi:uncharacterized protein Yka (UPF0111/DUF47 family)
MSGKESTVVNKLIDRVFPRMPDFYALINEQCDLMIKAMDELVDFMETGDMAEGEDIAHVLEKQGDELKRRNLQVLDTAFATRDQLRQDYGARDAGLQGCAG